MAGLFDRFWPNEEPVWVNISPYSSYTYEVWDRDLREVIEVTTTWLETKKHFVPRNQGKVDRQGKPKQKDFRCSCGPHKKLPCWGCAVRTAHYEKLDAIETKTGVRPGEMPPVGWSSEFHLAITVMEKIFDVPVRDKQGQPRKSKAGNLLYNHIPAPLMNTDLPDEQIGKSHFGQRCHWTMGSEHLDMLTSMDDEMKNHCANCADPMMAVATICPSCETVHKLAEPLSGVFLAKGRLKDRNCGACGEKQPHVMQYVCPGCGDPKEGSLTRFDIRIYKEMTGDKKSILKVAAVRVPGSTDPDTNKIINELIENPLNLSEIFAPTKLDSQKFILGDELTHGLSPAARKRDGDESSDTEGYNEETTEDKGIDF